ncbi:hypothetical protein RFI_34702 [Reticulomyxa filosa]|uniref:Uncharacterized protein n=1 Tax=Reticulomyxa filosa TaxID=46433 RepID=X6LMU9_RETFI|nr:hypothetical protein RFI_34702 [Reticulomyxa filosa]|eukprot:ETO02711.1 hypothetical protein RFI_34702 [Reticulomyxa filosa]
MRRSSKIPSCDVSWISPFKHEREILFARSYIFSHNDEKTHKEQYAWNAKVESEDEYTQMILLTWVRYDQYIQQTMQISAMWDHQIDFNLIYTALILCEKDVNLTIKLLFKFEQWKFRDNKEQNYKKRMNEFLERRCCNHNINLFHIFYVKDKTVDAIKWSKIIIVNDGLPFVKKDKKH